MPVGVDQDPHIRLTRGVAHKMRMFTVEERDGYISIRSKNAPEAALEAVKNAFPHAKKYEGHVDVKGAGCSDVKAKVREIERAHGGYAFFTPSSTYHIFMPGLTGGKMSSSVPESIISFYEPEAVVRKKVMSGITGGRINLRGTEAPRQRAGQVLTVPPQPLPHGDGRHGAGGDPAEVHGRARSPAASARRIRRSGS